MEVKKKIGLYVIVLVCVSCTGCADDEDYYKPDGKDIAFFGKVVDQNNDPVPSYELDCTLSTFLTAPNVRIPGKIRLDIITDEQGRFSVQNKGYRLNYDFRDAPGYSYSYEVNPKTRFGYDSIALPDSFEASESNPFIFVIHKKNYPGFLITTGNRTISIYEEDISQGFDASINIISPWINKDGLQGALPTGAEMTEHGRRKGIKDLRIQGQVSGDGTQCNIEVSPLIEGSGLIVSDDLLYEAPAEGYQASVQFSVLNRQRWEKQIYLKLDNGAFYGRLQCEIRYDKIETFPPDIRLSIESWINPEGSRNLEYDEEYQFQEEEWRYLLEDLRFEKSQGTRTLNERKELVEEYGLAYLPEWETDEQFFDELRQLRAKKDEANPKWWHALKE